jgi:hypothetical protein
MDKTIPPPKSPEHSEWLETLTQTYAEMALAGGDQALKDGRRDYLIARFKALEQDFPGITAMIHTKIRAMK